MSRDAIRALLWGPGESGWPFEPDELLVAVYADGTISEPENLPIMRDNPFRFVRITPMGEEPAPMPVRICMIKNLTPEQRERIGK